MRADARKRLGIMVPPMPRFTEREPSPVERECRPTGYAANHEAAAQNVTTVRLTPYEAEGLKALLNTYSCNPRSFPILVGHPFTAAQARRLSSSL